MIGATQTIADSRVKIGVHMPVMGGDREFQTTRLFAPDCSAARFTGNRGSNGGQRDDGVVDV
ncbi:hypothetical protein Bca52824_025969 [Brassica carinata]|uniref:Uncharacterized protein n=1 Tax=Brassica carinata TaxID=52824 RepID=A0A8X7SGW0_BRACI|nr:hypothetical protein Bca52824_025969 [Brassica carinata]